MIVVDFSRIAHKPTTIMENLRAHREWRERGARGGGRGQSSRCGAGHI